MCRGWALSVASVLLRRSEERESFLLWSSSRMGGAALVPMTIRTVAEQHLDLQPKLTPADDQKRAQASRTSCQFNRYLTSAVLKEAQCCCCWFFFRNFSLNPSKDQERLPVNTGEAVKQEWI